MHKLVSILIPVYNRETLIEETINSALSQTYGNIEIIIVDNKSTDKTWDILQGIAAKDSRVKIFQNESNIGPVRNWEICVNKANGIYGKILWSDDLIAPDFLEKTVSFLEDENVGFVFTGTEIFVDKTDKKSSHYFIGDTGIYENEVYINGVLFEGNYPVSPGCALFRLDDLKDGLLIDIPNKISSDFAMHAIGNDLLICLLTAYRYKKFAFVNERLAFFRAHDDSITIQSNRGKLALHYKIAGSYFIENYRPELIKKQNSMIWLQLNKYRKLAKNYELNGISDFYMKNKIEEIDCKFLLNMVIKKCVRYIINCS